MSSVMMKKTRHDAMLRAFDQFSARISSRYAEARKALADGDYVKAQEILANLGISHARTSLSLRNLLVREGLLKEDDK